MTAPRIGPTFERELAAAGCRTDGLAWAPTTGDVTFIRDFSAEERAGVLAVLAAHDPTTVPPEAIITERTRRLAAGFLYDFGDARGVHRIGTSRQDMDGWDEVTKLANAMLATQQGGTISIVTDTGAAEVTPSEWQNILLTASAFRQPIWAASFRLQQMVPIPGNYADDSHWVS